LYLYALGCGAAQPVNAEREKVKMHPATDAYLTRSD
jgi:hypothetical protein